MTVGNHGQTFKFSYDVFGSGAGTNFNNITGSTLWPRNYSSFIFYNITGTTSTSSSTSTVSRWNK